MKYIILLAAVVALAAVVVACKDDGGDGGDIPSPGVTVVIGQDATPIGVHTPTVIDVTADEVCQPNPSPATPEDQVLDQPGEGDTVTSPVTISGRVRAFEATYQVAVLDARGDPIVEPTFGTAGPGEIGQLAPFSIDVPFQVDETTPACIWVYELSARDGSQINIGQIPVMLSP